MAAREKGDLYYGGFILMLKGVFTALITPFNKDFSLDRDGFDVLIDYQLKSDVEGIVVLGTTGEAPTLTEEEQKWICKRTVELAKGKKQVWIGTGSYNTEQVIKKTKEAKDVGADGALIVTPYYNKPTQEGLYQHFKKVAESTRFPFILYNIQGRTGQNLATETLKRLMDLNEMVGVKEASGNLNQIMDVIEIARPGFAVLSGDDNLTYPIIALGGHGIVSVLSNLIPDDIADLTHLALTGKMESAKQLHFKLLPLFKGAFIETNPAPLKYLMKRSGLPAGPVRLPLVEVSGEIEKKLDAIWQPEILISQN